MTNKLNTMRKLSLLVPASAALLALSLVPAHGASSPTIEWVDPSPSPPEASAPLPPRESPSPATPAASSQTQPAETLPAPAQGSSRPPPAKPPHRLPATAVRLPPAQAPGNSPLTAEAANFMNAYWANVGGSSDQVLPYLGSIYAPVVDYYGKPATRDSILKDKWNFIRRWPIRQTWLPPSEPSPRISCNDATAECEITGVRDFDAVSPERGTRAVGLVRYSYTVRFAEGLPQIVAEDSKVVSHQ